MYVDSPRVLSLFAGIGGLDLAVRLVCPGARVVGYVEWDAYAASVLLGRMEDEALERAPVFCGDVRHLDGRELRGHVDLITAGFPCTDISLAGKREGIEGDASGLWAEVVRLVDETGAPYLYLENVAAIRSARGRAVGDTTGDAVRALGTVLADLAALGFDAEWLCLRASDVGAPHGLDRWFCLAHHEGEQRLATSRRPNPSADEWNNASWIRRDMAHRECERSQGLSPAGEEAGPTGRSDRATLADPGDGLFSQSGRGSEGRTGTQPAEPILADGSGDVADSGSIEHQRRGGTGDVRRETGEAEGTRDQRERGGVDAPGRSRPFPPGPADLDAWRVILAESPWLAPAIEPGVRVLADGIALVVDASRADQLRCLGNAVVPLQAAAALAELLRRID